MAANVEGTPHYQYIVLHQSLLDHKGMIAVHAAHAAGESCFSGPAPEDTRCVVLVAKDSDEILQLASELRDAYVIHRVIVETDGLRAGQATALGTMPIRDRDKLRNFFPRDRFPVLR